MLQEATKGTIRRLLGYPTAGQPRISPSGQTLADGGIGYRFMQAYGMLEFRMNNLTPSEEAMLTGLATGSVQFMGNNPTAGDTVTLSFTGGGLAGTTNITATAVAGDTLLTMINRLANAVNANATLVAAGFYSLAPYGTGPYSNTQFPLPECTINNPAVFAMTATNTGTTVPVVGNNGSVLPFPQSTVDPSTNPVTVKCGYLPIITYLEGAHAGSTQNLDTAKADVWTARPNEIQLRTKLLNMWLNKLSQFLGIPRGDSTLYGGNTRSVRARI